MPALASLPAIIDTKWKKLSLGPLDRKHGVSQADFYQLMAYARLYPARELMLLYPGRPPESLLGSASNSALPEGLSACASRPLTFRFRRRPCKPFWRILQKPCWPSGWPARRCSH